MRISGNNKIIMNKYKNFFFYCGILLFASEIWKQVCLTYLNNGHYNWWYFPFQLCSIPMYVCLAVPFVNSEKVRKILFTFLMDFGLIAGTFTFFDTTGLHYSYAPLTVHSFAWHILLIIIGIRAGFSKKADYSGKGFTGSLLIFLACCLLATVFNLAFYQYGMINMFYISPHYNMTQIVFIHIARRFGNAVGIFVYIASIIFGACVLHMMWSRLSDKLHAFS